MDRAPSSVLRGLLSSDSESYIAYNDLLWKRCKYFVWSIDHSCNSPLAYACQCSNGCRETAPTIGKAPQRSCQICLYTPTDELMMNAQGSSGTSARAGNCWKWRIPRIQFTRLLRVSSCSLIFMFLATWDDSQTTRRFQVSSVTRDPWNNFYRS